MRLSGITDTFAIFAGKVATYRNGSPSHFRFHLHEPSPARPTMAKVVNHTSESKEGIYLSNQSKKPSVSISHLKWKTVLRVLSLSDRKLRITMPRFFNLRRRKQPVVMSYIDEIKDEEVLRVVKHIRNRAGLPALPPNGGPNSSRTMKTEESDDRSVGGKAAGPVEQQPPKEPLALVAEVGSEIQEPPQNGPCSHEGGANVRSQDAGHTEPRHQEGFVDTIVGKARIRQSIRIKTSAARARTARLIREEHPQPKARKRKSRQAGRRVEATTTRQDDGTHN
jgi:hypothetical protein